MRDVNPEDKPLLARMDDKDLDELSESPPEEAKALRKTGCRNT